MKHWSKWSVYAVAKAVSEQHGMDWLEAFRLVWYSMHRNETPPQSVPAIEARMGQVEYVPEVPEKVLEMFQASYRNKLRGGLE